MRLLVPGNVGLIKPVSQGQQAALLHEIDSVGEIGRAIGAASKVNSEFSGDS